MEKLKTFKMPQLEQWFCSLLLFSLFIFPANLFALDSLSYSGRLVNANGSPVTDSVNLKVDLAYTNSPASILCTQSFTNVGLTNGVFHLKLDLTCTPNPFEYVLENIPLNESIAIRITDETNGKAYSYQALHSMPMAKISETSKKLVQMGATDGQVLTWDSGEWKPLTPAESVSDGSVTTAKIADGAVTNVKVATGIARGKLATGTPNYVLINDSSGFMSEAAQLGVLQGGTGASTAAGARANLGIVIGTAAGQFMGADAVPSCAADEKLFMTLGPTYLWDCIPDGDATKLPLAGGQMTGAIDMFTHRILDLGSPVDPGDAANKAYVDAEIAGINDSQWTTAGSNIHFNTGNVGLGISLPSQRLDIDGSAALTGSLKLKSDTAFYTDFKAPIGLASTLVFTLPNSYGADGYTLTTDGFGKLSWSSPAVGSAGITDGSIVNADISPTAGIDQSKIAGLGTTLSTKEPVITGSTVDQYWRGDKTWGGLETDVRGTDLLGLTTSPGAVTDTDTILSAIGKLSGNQVNYVLKAGDTMSGALSMGTNKITDLGTPTLDTDASTKKYVDDRASKWTLTGSDIYNNTGKVGIGNMTPAEKLDVVGNMALTGNLRLKFDTVNFVELKAPAGLTTNVLFTLPGSDGTSGQALVTNGTGGLSWSSFATTSTTVGGDLSGTISSAEIKPGVVGTAEITDASIADADVSETAAIAQSKIANLEADLAAKEATILNGTTTQYWSGDKSWQELNTTAVTEGTRLYFTEARVRATPITGYAAIMGVLDGTETILQALGKLQGQITANDAAFDSSGQWGKSGSNIYYSAGSVGVGTSAIPVSKFQVVGGDITIDSGEGLNSAAGAQIYTGLNGHTWHIQSGDPLANIFSALDSAGAQKLNLDAVGNLTVNGTIHSTVGGIKFPDGSLQTTATGGTAKYIKVQMSGYQTVDNGSIVAFDSIASNNGMSMTGNGVNLKAGHTYRIEVMLNTYQADGAGYVGYHLFNGSTTFGAMAYTDEPDSVGNYGFHAGLLEFFTPGVDTTVSVRIGDDNIGTGQITPHYNTYFIVTEVISGGISGASDNLGNHTASQNIQLGSNWLSGDGGSEGIKVDAAGNVGIGTAAPAAKLEVNGVIAGKAIKTRLFNAGGKNSTSCILSSVNTMEALNQFCDLVINLTLTDPATVQINYSITMSPGPDGTPGSKHLVTGIDIDGVLVTTTITGIQTTDTTVNYWGAGQSHFAELAAGTHTIKVLYRTPAGGESDPSASDWGDRKLQVLILGYQ